MGDINRHQTDLNRMCRDIEAAAEIAGVPHDSDVINCVLDAYGDFYSAAPVTFVTSTRPQEDRGLSVRYVDLQVPHDPYETALKQGFISEGKHPIYRLIPQIRSRFSMLGYGVDMEASYGLTKIWPFVVPGPIENLFELSALPAAIKNHARYFSRHHLNVFSLLALDFRNKSTNIYFMVKRQGQLTPQQVARMIRGLDFPVPTDEVLNYCTRAVTIYYTFSWDSPQVQRLCFGMAADGPHQVPLHLHPLLEQYTRRVPILDRERKFIFSITACRGGDYIKIESDYTGSMIDLMKLGAQSIPEPPARTQGFSHLENASGYFPGYSPAKKIEWEPEVDELFEKITAKVPDAFRAMVKPLLRETAENKCLGRNAAYVGESDLITALFDITPQQFKAESIDNLNALGVDVRRYTELKEIKDQLRVSWEKFGKAFHPGNLHTAMYLTDRCNQQCLHCAAGSQTHRPELSTGQWIHIIENLESSLRKQGRHGVYIWFGGEPTCREDIGDLIKYCGNHDYFQAIITNGILFDEDFARLCADNGMSHVFVSFDSADPRKNDTIRGSNHSLEFAEKAVKNALKYGLFVCCSSTVMKQNIDELDEMKTLAESWGAVPYFRAVVKQKKAAENWEKIGLTHSDYKKLYDFKYKQAITAIRLGKAGTLPIYSIFEMVPFPEQPLNDSELSALEWGVGCQACRVFNGIDVNGDVFPCGYPSQLTLGNALNQRFEDIMNSQIYKDIRDKKRTGKCAPCHHLSLCGGGCRIHAESETGDFFSSFSYCWHKNDHQHP